MLQTEIAVFRVVDLCLVIALIIQTSKSIPKYKMDLKSA